MSGLFDYARRRGRRDLTDGPFAVIDVETTGLSPERHRVIEMAVARVESGRVVDEWSSLLDAGCDPGPTWIHRITSDHLAGAPTFKDVVGAFLERIEGAVVVAHNASFEEGFLAAELARAGIRLPRLPALCSLELARKVLDAPNHRLQTCCATTGIELTDAHTALGDVRATAALLASLLEQASGLAWRTDPPPLPKPAVRARPRTRASQLRKGEEGWMASLLSKLPLSTGHLDVGAAEAYLAAAEAALEDGKLTGDEARALARLAGEGGLGAAQVKELNRRLLDGLREAALADDVITSTELRELNRAARLLAEPDYFADVVVDVDDRPKRVVRRTRTASKGRLWLHPDLRDQHGERVTAAGYTLGQNVTRTLIAVVVPAGIDQRHPRIRKALELGVEVITIDDLPRLLGEERAVGEASPPPYQGPTPPLTAWGQAPPSGDSRSTEVPLPTSAWYPDPAGRHRFRYWDGSGWTGWVSDGHLTNFDPPVR